MQYSPLEMFQVKSPSGLDLYSVLLERLNPIGSFNKISKAVSVSFENRKVFATVMIRDRSIKLVLRAGHKIASPRILNVERVAERDYEHTILVETKSDIDDELIDWMSSAYQASL